MFKLAYTYRHVDVFSTSSLAGNGLIVFENAHGLTPEQMQKITQEMRQYETLFLFPEKDIRVIPRVRARIYTLEEELDFAGHPILGAAAVLHEKHFSTLEHSSWSFELNHKTVDTRVEKQKGYYLSTMDQGRPEFLPPLKWEQVKVIAQAFNLSQENLHDQLPPQVVSTGLPYLILPLKSGLNQVRLTPCHLESQLLPLGAKFVYLLHVETLEARTWDNEGKAEDIATGSAAGPAGAYLVHHKKQKTGQVFTLKQGKFLKRESFLHIQVKGTSEHIESVEVSGPVSMFARGILDI